MKVSIIIPTFNRRKLLAKTLPSVINQAFPPEEYEVVIAVDGSTDGTTAMLRSLKPQCGFTILELANSGPANARNAAAAAAQADLLLFLDDDIICSSTLISAHAAAHDAGDSKIVAHGPIFVSPESPSTLIALSTSEWYKAYNRQFGTGERLNPYKRPFLIGNASMRRDLFVSCGRFDPRMLLLEDVELSLRLFKAGAQFTYCPDALTHEIFSKSTQAYLGDSMRHGKAEVILCRMHPDYRPFSRLNTLGSGTIIWRFLRRILLCCPISPNILLNPIISVLERYSRSSVCWRAGLALLSFSHRFGILRSAVDEAGSYRMLIAQFGMRLPVLMYHHVGPLRFKNNSSLTVSPRRFKTQMLWLWLKRYKTINARQWIEWATKCAPLPRKPILLTFDDGYADLAAYAFPLLRHFGFTAEVFLVTRSQGGENSWDSHSQSGALALLTAEAISVWSRNGISFGAHTRTHAALTDCSFSEIEDEIGGSARDLTEITGRPPVAFAYPYGAYNSAAQSIVKLHFQCAFTTDEGLNDITTDPFRLKRLWIPRNRWLLDFALQIWFGWSPFTEIRSRLKIRTRAILIWRKIIGKGGAR